LPRYDYHCPACDNTFELTQSFDSEPAADCPVCGHASRRLISHPAIHFKGSGFYSTDNRSASAANGAARASTEERESSEKAKPASSSDTATASSANKSSSSDTAASPSANKSSSSDD